MDRRNDTPLVLAAIAGCAFALAACASTSAPGTAAAPVAPSLAAGPSAPVTPSVAVAVPSVTLTAAPSLASGGIPEGTYRTEPIPVSTIIAHIEADRSVSAAAKAAAESGFKDHKTEIIELDLHGGQFTERDAFDGGPLEVGARATYVFADPQTMVIQENCCGLSTFSVATQPNGFSLRYKAGAPNAGEDVVGQTVYESSPFTLVP